MERHPVFTYLANARLETWSTVWAAVADVRVQRACEYILKHYSSDRLALQDVAHHVRMSKWHLSRLLNSATGWGFTDHLAAVRVARASRMLVDGRLIVKEVAGAVGYRYVSQMDRQFKRLLGILPQNLRCRAAVQFELQELARRSGSTRRR